MFGLKTLKLRASQSHRFTGHTTNQKKIFFVHVGKTAGSSVNAFLKEKLKGEIHCERYLDWQSQTFSNTSYLKTLDYISGHAKIESFFNSGFCREEYILATFVRYPLHQLLSHLNWIIHIYDVSPSFFKNHPQKIQDICLELRKSDLSNLSVLKNTLYKYRGLFQNNQSRFFSDDAQLLGSSAVSVQTISDSVVDVMKELDVVGITEFYEESLKELIQAAGYQFPVRVHSANRNRQYALSKDILEDHQFRSFLSEYNAVDMEVYEFWRNEFSKRQALLSLEN